MGKTILAAEIGVFGLSTPPEIHAIIYRLDAGSLG